MIHIRDATILDLREVFEWRNDKLAVEMSLNTNQIIWDSHVKWFKKVINSQKQCLLICKHKNSKKSIGYVRFDIISNEANVSINLSPVMRGQGLAKECLETGILFFNKKFSNVLTLNAEVKTKNVASIKIFKQVGFYIIKKTDVTLVHQYVFKKD